MPERTEEQKLCQDPIVVVLGKTEYKIEPLTIKQSREWRKELVSLLQKLPTNPAVTTENSLGSLFQELPDLAADLFFSYARGLDREKIEGEATDAELEVAFVAVLAYANPLGLAKSLAKGIPRLA